MCEVRDLKPNGANILVTEENKKEYVHLVCQMKMTGEDLMLSYFSCFLTFNNVEEEHLSKPVINQSNIKGTFLNENTRWQYSAQQH